MKYEHHFESIHADKELLTKIMRQDVQAFNELYNRYWGPLLRFASQFLDDQDSCKDIVQGLFAHLHIRHQSLKITTAIRPYLYASVRHRIYNYVRDRSVYKRHIALANGRAVSFTNDVEQFMDFTELKERIAQCLSEMPVKYKEVYLLHFQGQHTIKKVAHILNRPVDTVEKQLRRAKVILNKYLKQVKNGS